jgi:c-di-GMP-related signal transduction protein
MSEFASLSNTYLIAEGIETENELLKLIDIGVYYGQGFLIQKPNAAIFPISSEIMHIINEANRKKNHLWGNRISNVYISNICRPQKSINRISWSPRCTR